MGNLTHPHSSLRVHLWEISPMHTAASGCFYGKYHTCTQQPQGASVGNLTHAKSSLRVHTSMGNITHACTQQPQGASVGNLTHAKSSLRELLREISPMHKAASGCFCGETHPCTQQPQSASVGNLTHGHSSLRVLLWEISTLHTET